MADKNFIHSSGNTGTQQIKAPNVGKKKTKPAAVRGKDLRSGK